MIKKLMTSLTKYALASTEIADLDARIAKLQTKREELLDNVRDQQMTLRTEMKDAGKLVAAQLRKADDAIDAVITADEGEELDVIKKHNKDALSESAYAKALKAQKTFDAEEKKKAIEQEKQKKADEKKAAAIAAKDAKLKAKLSKKGIIEKADEKPKAAKKAKVTEPKAEAAAPAATEAPKNEEPTPATIDRIAENVATEAPAAQA